MNYLTCVAVAAALVCLEPAGALAEEPDAPPRYIEAFAIQGLFSKSDIDEYKKAANQRLQCNGDRHVKSIARNNLAVWQWHCGEYKEALANLNEAIQLAPGTFGVYYSNRGMTYRALGRYDEAIQDYERALESPNRPVARLAQANMGWLLLLQSQTDLDASRRQELLARAEELLQAATEKSAETAENAPFIPLAWINLAALRLTQHKVDAAEVCLKQVQEWTNDNEGKLKQFPADYQCYLLNQGEVERCGNRWQEARKLYQAAYDLGNNAFVPRPPPYVAGPPAAKENPLILQRLGAAEFVLKNYGEAQSHLEEAAKRYGPEKPAGRYALLLCAVAKAHRHGQYVIEIPEAVAEHDTPRRWTDGLFWHLAGKWNDKALADAACDPNDRIEKTKRGEAAFYRALKCRLEGNTRAAEDLFKTCVNQCEETSLEHTMAKGLRESAEAP